MFIQFRRICNPPVSNIRICNPIIVFLPGYPFAPLGLIGILFFVGRGSHRLPIICRHSVTLPAGIGVSAAAIGHDPP